MEAFLLRIDELKDDVLKTKLIEEIYDNGEASDKYASGTRTRVNSLVRIIKAGRVIEALEVVASSRLRIDFPEVLSTAKDLLKRIESGEFAIPE